MRDAALPGVAIGFFDGVHLGHRQILSGVARVITFRNHPLSVLRPEKAPRLIMSCEKRVAALRACGVRTVDLLDFTPELAARSPEEFLSEMALTPETPVRCGANWRFGRGGVGSGAWLAEHGYRVTVVPMTFCRGEPISSSRIRQTFERGEIAFGNEMLGVPLTAEGRVFVGKGEGRRLGFPTVNLRLEDFSLRLPLGVYEVEVCGVRALANFGLAPTFGASAWEEPVLEIHFVEGDAPTFGARLTVAFRAFLRPEQKFLSLDDLRRQIAADCAAFRARRG